MRSSILTIILLIAAITAVWAQRHDKKTIKLEKQLVGTFVGVPDTHYTIVVHGKDSTETIQGGGADPFRINSEKRYDAPSPRIGFRVIARKKVI